jgi:hypothetical protein
MPRIRNIGEFDWRLLPHGANQDVNFDWKLCLYFFLYFDEEVWHAPGVYRDNDNPEEVAYNDKGVSLPTGAIPGLFSTLKLEEDTKVLPSRAREIARFLSLQEWSTSAIAGYYPGSWNRILYSVGVKRNNKVGVMGEILHPTRFIMTLARKINKWTRETGLSAYGFVQDPEILTQGKEIGQASLNDREYLERLVIRASKLSGQRIGWVPDIRPEAGAHILAIGDRDTARKVLREIIRSE